MDHQPSARVFGRQRSAGRKVWSINEGKLAEIARREAQDLYRLAAKATNEVIWDLDRLTGEVHLSESAAEVLGWPDLKATTSQAWWAERIHPDDQRRVLDSVDEAFKSTETHWSSTYRLLRADGSYGHLLDRGFIVRSEDGEAVRFVGVIADLTERYRVEAELQRLQAELLHVSRVSAMGTMAATLAHELNQPLTAVRNYIGGIRRMVQRSTADPALFSALEAAESGALRAGEIVRRLREMVSRGRVTVTEEHLPKLIEEANELAFMDAQLHGIRHRVELDPAACWVRADRIQIQQVLINLVRNAVEAMEDSPIREIVVSTGLQPDDMVVISVADTGPGIPPENIEALFSRFMTTKTDGIGLGLPISRTIIEAHGGQIWAENRKEGGAAFRFTLPHGKG